MSDVPVRLVLIIAIVLIITWDLMINQGSWFNALTAYINDLMWKIGPI